MRPFRDGDAEPIAALTLAAISAIGPHAYSPEQVQAWADRHPGAERFRARVTKGAIILVATDPEDQPVAYALLEQDGHLDMLYCHPDHTKQGLAEALLERMEQRGRSLGIARLYTEASELARPAFERAGYSFRQRRDFEINGVPIHNYAMEKLLD